jgi:hypothetical protein
VPKTEKLITEASMTLRRSKKDQNQKHNSQDAVQEQPKFPRPKILLIDIEDDAASILKAEGYSIATGSFGKPYRVEKGDGFHPVIMNGSLPQNYAEQEIVVIDLAGFDILEEVQGEKHTSMGENDWWASCSEGVIDPRPRRMAMVQDDLERILSHGGAVIVFAAPRYQQKLVWAKIPYGHLIQEKKINYNNWSFLSTFDRFEMKHDRGEEINVALTETTIGSCLADYAKNASFSCTLHQKWEKEEEPWLVLATNKYETPVAGALVLTNQKLRGWIFIFPQLQDKPHFLARFFKEVLPGVAPHLFPHVEGAKWVQRPEYELPKILELTDEIRRIQEEARQQVTDLEQAIEEERIKLGYLHDLLTETGRLLVIAVKKTLETLGFTSVIDVDEEMEQQGDTGPKREDLQIRDASPVVLVEVKGIAGLPRDAEALQVWKYLAPRMKEWDRTDVVGLAIVNHQRHLPALDRENNTPFREDLITNAEEQGFGLLTTLDLFRLARSFLRNGWRPEQVRPLFYRAGRIEPIPTHYLILGVVEHFWPKAGAVGVRVQKVELRLGDRLAFELPVEFVEQDVESLQVDNEPVNHVEIGQLAGVKTHFTKDQIKKGVRVFLVRSD